ncbi:hypothetical protein OC188_02510 [Anaplasma capra]|uniref:hypothetical protein n=1 Tax=Anaplasma capra TaxID=1562740 RepID=UPI0021D596EC|nr:hypothetical protein [Anaplasma capra]MCU7611566.1 hypothetical protein [Anaplasma capra]
MRILLAFCAVCCGLFPSFSLFGDSIYGSSDRGGIVPHGRGDAARGADDGFSFDGEILFYSWRGRAMLPKFSGGIGPMSSFGDSMRAEGRISKDLEWSGDCDFIGNLAFEYAADSGILYGADFQLLIPEVRSAVEGSGKAVVNRGSRVFALTPYGKFSLGCQEGVESVVASLSSGGAFDDFVRGRDLTLVKYKLPTLKGDFLTHGEGWWWLRSNAALLYPGLYSESVFRENSVIDYYGSDERSRHYSKYFVNNLPFRFSYQSPKLFGIKFGLSYSPTGYDEGLFRAYNYKDVLYDGEQWEFVDNYADVSAEHVRRSGSGARSKLGGGAPQGRLAASGGAALGSSRILLADDVLYAPAYKHVISAAVSTDSTLTFGREAVRVGAAFAAEWAPARGVEGYGSIAPDGGFCALSAVGVSAGLGVRGLDFGFGYGYLGTSGYSRGRIVGTAIEWDRGGADPAWRPSSYLVAGLGYGTGPVRAELSYFTSVRGGYLFSSEVDDFGARVSYELYRSIDVQCALFLQLHRVSVGYDFAKGFVRDSGASGHLSYDFDVFMSGVKLVF